VKGSEVLGAIEEGKPLVYKGVVYRDLGDIFPLHVVDLYETPYWEISHPLLVFREAMAAMLAGDTVEYDTGGSVVQWRLSTTHKGTFKRRIGVHGVFGGWTAALFGFSELDMLWYVVEEVPEGPKKLTHTAFVQVVKSCTGNYFNEDIDRIWRALVKAYPDLVEANP